jgi:hypothetical protein
LVPVQNGQHLPQLHLLGVIFPAAFDYFNYCRDVSLLGETNEASISAPQQGN